ncbi:MAG: hydrogen gas-evolving membrane-bound hydrogenase subunit E, partial [Arcanobacterium sp.]|nr:hydrogen gas-evolving membrane-bound hydrogenase subunit E [Arcanobacterium sp.]
LKLVLAFGTVSQLGLLMVLVGYGTKATMLAGLALLIAHALFKSTLFLAVGFLDWATGTRDLRALSGMGRKMPVLAVFTTIAAASMMGLPPLAGFVAKEAALHALIDGEGLDQVSWILIAVGSIFTVGYSLRFLWGAFATKSGVESLEVKPSSGLMLSPIVLLGSLSLLAGFAYKPIEEILAPHANQLPGEAGHLALWSGFNLPLLVTLFVVLFGCVLFFFRVPFGVVSAKFEFPLRADASYQAIIRGLEKLSGVVTGYTQRGSLPAYLSTIFSFALLTGTIALFAGNLGTFAAVRPYDSLAQLGVGAITCLAAILGARARHRLKAVLLMGVAGYGVALLYILYGAPDLALTQVLSETMTLVVFVLVLRRLPAYFSNRPIKLSRWSRIVLALLVGTSAAIIAWYAAGSRRVTPISEAFHDEAYYFGYGSNIVNVTLVDIRAWDTFGEISVVVAAAIGISSLLFIRDKGARIDRFRNLPSLHPKAEVWGKPYDATQQPAWTRTKARQIENTVTSPGRNRLWLVGSKTLASPRRSVILEVGTRFIFHTMVIISLYFLFAGHNFPGGGFAAGIMAGIALVLRYIAGGRYELGAAVPLHPGHLLGSGLALAGISAITPVFFGGTILQTAKFIFTLPVFGEVKFATALIFDIGVYFVVIGLVLDILRSLGAEIDRHGEVEGIEEQDDVLITPDSDRRRESQEASEAEHRHIYDDELEVQR